MSQLTEIIVMIPRENDIDIFVTALNKVLPAAEGEVPVLELFVPGQDNVRKAERCVLLINSQQGTKIQKATMEKSRRGFIAVRPIPDQKAAPG